jgi:hypothetical protein
MISPVGRYTNNLPIELEPIMYLILLALKLVCHVPYTHSANISLILG